MWRCTKRSASLPRRGTSSSELYERRWTRGAEISRAAVRADQERWLTATHRAFVVGQFESDPLPRTEHLSASLRAMRPARGSAEWKFPRCQLDEVPPGTRKSDAQKGRQHESWPEASDASEKFAKIGRSSRISESCGFRANAESLECPAFVKG